MNINNADKRDDDESGDGFDNQTEESEVATLKERLSLLSQVRLKN